MLTEIARLRFSRGGMSATEYFEFRLYEDDLPFDEKRAFVGKHGQRVLDELTADEFSMFLAYDKLTMSMLLRGLGLPIPSPLALYCGWARSCPFPVLQGAAQLTRFLEKCQDYPIYLKPCHGHYGRGNASLTGFSDGGVVLGDGTRVPVDEFVGSLRDRSGLGWLIQKTLLPHREIVERCGRKISGVRFYALLSARGPVIHRAVWKINVGKRDADNFDHGTSGNLLGAIDLATGTITRVVGGLGATQVQNPVHPVTGRPLVDVVLPEWERARSVVLRGTAAFPGFISQGWDVALCDEGPVLMEVNVPNVDISQLSYRKGFLDDACMGYLEELGILHLFHGPSQPWRAVRGGARRGRRAQHWKWW
jgi:hypothetical protein